MQLLESSDAGLRAAIIRCTRPGAALLFRLFPMLHVGAPEYYPEALPGHQPGESAAQPYARRRRGGARTPH